MNEPMDAAQILSLVIAAVSGAGVLLAYFKFKPGERERVGMDVAEGNINVAQGTLNIAQGTIELVTQTLEERFRAMNAEMDAMRLAHDQYRRDTDARIAELSAELRAERDEKVAVNRENEELKARVGDLEAEVARLKVSPDGP